MTHSILNDCLTIWQSSAVDKTAKLQEYFDTINVYIFNKLLASKDSEKAAIMVMFAIIGFSEESPMVVIKQDSIEEKRNICKYLGVTDSKLIDEIAYLRDRELKEAATDYLVAFAGEEFRSLMFCKIQLADYEYDITNRMFRESIIESTGDEGSPTRVEYTYDIKEHNRAVLERARLAKEIEKMERTQIQKNKHKFVSLNKMEDWIRTGGGTAAGKTKRTGHPETFIQRNN
jgi:hypothetical protein